jgi:isoquinoline 1-oxidoreductase alpha subunit
MANLRINGKDHPVDADPTMPLLWAIRDFAGLTGTKYGCGIGQCGACTVHINGKAARSCRVPISEAAGLNITTIEGLDDGHPVRRAWAQFNVPACGFCQPGQMMQAAAFLRARDEPEDAEIVKAMSGNLCRCGTYQRIVQAIRAAAGVGR